MNFDMNACWSRGVELVQSNFQLLLVISAIFLLLPTVAIYLLVPDFQSFVSPTTDPDELAAQMGEIAGPLIAGALVASLFQFAGYASMVALMSDSRPTVGQAIGTGVKAVPSLLIVMVSFALIYILGAIVIMLPLSLLLGLAGIPALGVLAIIPVLLYVVWLMARFSMTMPVLALGKSLNPFKAMGASFTMTKPKQWAILGFWGVFFAVFFVISLLFNGLASLVAALSGTGLVAMLIAGLANGLTSMISGMIICGLAVAMYGQLAGPSIAKIEDTFE